MATDRIDRIYDVASIEAQHARVKAIINDLVTSITDASRKSRLSDLFTADGNLQQSAQLIKNVSAALKEQVTAVNALSDANVRAAEAEMLRQKAMADTTKQSKQQAEANAIVQREAERAGKLAARAAEERNKARSVYANVSRQYNDAATAAKNLAAAEMQAGVAQNHFSRGTKDAIVYAGNLHKQLSAVDETIADYSRNINGCNTAQEQFSSLLKAIPGEAQNTETFLQSVKGDVTALAGEMIKGGIEGRSFKTILAGIGKSASGITALLNIAVIAVDYFAKRIAETETPLSRAEEANRKYEKSIKDIDEKAEESAAKEVARIRLLQRNAEDENLGRNKRIRAVEQLQQLYPDYLGNMDTEAIMSGKATAAIDGLTKAINQNAVAKLYAEKYAVAFVRMREIWKSYAQSIRDVDKAEKALDDARRARSKQSGVPALNTKFGGTPLDRAEGSAHANLLYRKRLKEQLEKQYVAASYDVGNFQLEEQDALSKVPDLFFAGKGRRPVSSGIRNKKEINQTQATEDRKTEITTRGADKRMEINAQVQESSKQGLDEELDNFESHAENMQALAEGMGEGMAEAGKHYTEQLKDAYKELSEELKTLFLNIGKVIFENQEKDVDEQIKKNEAQSNQRIAQINKEAITEEEKQQKIREVETETQINREQLEGRKREIAVRQARFEKTVSIGSIIAKTAEAVVGALKIPVYGTVLAATYAAIGAMQLANVIAQPIPQYYRGRKGGKAEFAIVGEKGAEAIVGPDGKGYLTPGKPTLAFLNEGDSVLTNKELLSMKSGDHFDMNTMRHESFNARELAAIFERQAGKINYASDKIVEAIERKPSQVVKIIGKDWANYLNKNL